MSFILDALKKSESERHRQSGPVLMDVRIAPPRRRIPPWAWVIAAVLAVNLALLAWILWLSPARRAAPAAAVVATAPANPAQPTPAAADPAVTAPAQAAAPTAPTTPAPEIQPPAALPPGTIAPPAMPPAAAAAPASQPLQPEPATPAQDIDITALPKVSDMMAAGVGLPTMQLNWHVYDAQPQGRYVLLNGARLREGEFTSEGVRVAAIVPTGVVVEWRGRRMFLNAGR